jgi:hypothetical protein
VALPYGGFDGIRRHNCGEEEQWYHLLGTMARGNILIGSFEERIGYAKSTETSMDRYGR